MTTARTARDGVDTSTLPATRDAVAAPPDAGRFQFRAYNAWRSGTRSRGTVYGFFGAGEERTHAREFHLDADQPAVLAGEDAGPTPLEHLLHALGACLAGGVATAAAARGVTLTEVRSHVSGDLDLTGTLGPDPAVRTGFQRIRVRVTVRGDAPPATLREIVERSRARSAVLDVLTAGVPVTVEVTTG